MPRQFIDAYLERYAEVGRYMDETLALAEDEGKVETLYGRVRWLPEHQEQELERCGRTPSGWRSTPASRAPPPTCSKRR